jgi:hypothetical protein
MGLAGLVFKTYNADVPHPDLQKRHIPLKDAAPSPLSCPIELPDGAKRASAPFISIRKLSGAAVSFLPTSRSRSRLAQRMADTS